MAAAVEGATRRRFAGADFARAAAALGVITLHAAHWTGMATPRQAMVWNGVIALCVFTVPAFVVGSGFLAGLSGPVQSRRGAYIARRARRALLPWLVWAVVFTVWGFFVFGRPDGTLSGVVDFITGGPGHLYFLILIPQFYFCYLIWPRGIRSRTALAMGALAVQAALDLWRLDGGTGGVHGFVLNHGFELSPFWGGYFAIGVLLGGMIREGAGVPPALVAAVTVAAVVAAWPVVAPPLAGDLSPFAGGTGLFLRADTIPFALLTAMALLLGGEILLRRVRETGGFHRAVHSVSTHALGIYVLQALVINLPGRILFPALQGRLLTAVPALVLFVAATFALSWAAAVLLSRTPLAWTIGESRSRETKAATAVS